MTILKEGFFSVNSPWTRYKFSDKILIKGIFVKKKVGRNDPCPCGSKKKFKNCCAKNMLGKKFLATKPSATNASGLTGLFQNRVESSKSLSARNIVKGPVSKAPSPRASEEKSAKKTQDPNSQKET